MTDAVNGVSLEHPHEPRIAPVFDDEGRCLVCVNLVARDAYYAEVNACPEPHWHESHRYCPRCPWTEFGYRDTYIEFGDDAPALRLRDMAKGWAPHRSNPHYSGATTCEHGQPLPLGWVEIALETESAHALLDFAKVPDGHPQGGGDIDTRTAKLVLRTMDAESRLAVIAAHHEQVQMGGGIVSGYCAECERVWPCPTHLSATGQRDPNLQPWDPNDDEAAPHPERGHVS